MDDAFKDHNFLRCMGESIVRTGDVKPGELMMTFLPIGLIKNVIVSTEET